MDNNVQLSTIHELFDHNYWARDRQIQVIEKLTTEQFTKELSSSFSSIRDTIVHMAGVEKLWLERWLGQIPKPLFDPNQFPTIQIVKDQWSLIEMEVKEYLSSLSEKEIEKEITCVSTSGDSWAYPLWRMFSHLLMHQSYHRGQVTTLLRQLGVVPPKVDFLDAHEMNFILG